MVILEQRLEGGEKGSVAVNWGKFFPGKGSSRCKGPEEGTEEPVLLGEDEDWHGQDRLSAEGGREVCGGQQGLFCSRCRTVLPDHRQMSRLRA